LPPDTAAFTPAAIADPTTAAAAEARRLFLLGFAFAVIFGLAEAGLRAGLAARLADFFAVLRDDREADFRAEALLAVFFLACFFAFLAERAGFFRAMTNPFQLP
jgi:hypothetical protein